MKCVVTTAAKQILHGTQSSTMPVRMVVPYLLFHQLQEVQSLKRGAPVTWSLHSPYQKSRVRSPSRMPWQPYCIPRWGLGICCVI